MNHRARELLRAGARPLLAFAVALSILLVGRPSPALGATGITAPQAPSATLTGATTHGTCHRPPSFPVVAAPVPGSTTDWTITSFDGTQIRVHWFPVAHPPKTGAPTVLMGPGWGSAGDDSPSTAALFGGLSIDGLRAAGYNVLTWDPRGFGASTGTVEVDSTAYEARDVGRLLDWLATVPGVQLDGPGDPRVGMVGASYGGGIQLVTAAVDCRIDAIVPTIAWNSLATSLDKAHTVKLGWSNLLYAGAARHSLDPHVNSAHQQSVATGTLDASDANWFARHTSDVAHVDVPTLIVQGTVDTLFTLDEGVANYENLKARHVPTSMIWFCGGHGVCLTNPGSQAFIATATIDWLDRYVKRQSGVGTGPNFRFVDQNGVEYSAPGYPLPATTPITASGNGTLHLLSTGGSGPAHPPANHPDPLAGIADSVTPAKASNAVDVTVSWGSRRAMVVGAPKLTLTYHGTSEPGVRPTRVFAQLVDDKTGLVLGNQVTPIDLVLDGHSHHVAVPLELVAFAAQPGQHVTLQLVATTVAYAPPQLYGSVTFTHIGVDLPVAAHLTPR